MSTTTARMWRVTLLSLMAGVGFLAGGRAAQAAVGSDISGAIIVYPKVVVDTSGVFGPPTDTEIQLTNTSNSVVSARCYWVNANSYCSNAPTTVCTQATVATDCPAGGTCVARWGESDFRFTLTKRQPISFNASDGMLELPLTDSRGLGGQSNNNADGSPSAILPVPDDPFIGELRCVEVDPTDFLPTIGFNPANDAAGDLAGHASIVATHGASSIDARKYNAVVLQSTTINNRDDTLILGGAGAEYDGCPNVLIMDHLFDGAIVPAAGTNLPISTDLTVVPCSENYRIQENDLGGAVLQFLVFNEFEQRFSASQRFSGFEEIQLSNIDTRVTSADNNKSIFNVAVQGTLSGQTRVRPVVGMTRANGILGITERFVHGCDRGPDGLCSSAENIHFTGARDLSDYMVLSPELP